MKYSTWLPKHSPLPRTLADVPSSREKPVLCWWSRYCILPLFVESGRVWRLHNDIGPPQQCDELVDARNFKLYDPPSRPTKLEDVPDRRIVQASWKFNGKLESFLMFKVKGQWLDLKGESGFKSYNNPADWQLTDHVAELVETEIGVV